MQLFLKYWISALFLSFSLLIFPQGETCETAIETTLLLNNVVDLSSGGPSNNQCYPEESNSRWFYHEAFADEQMTIRTNCEYLEANPNTRLSIYTGECGNLECIATSDSAGISLGSSVYFTATSDQTYYFEWNDYLSSDDFQFLFEGFGISFDCPDMCVIFWDGYPCDDGDPNTINDMIDGQECLCYGEFIDCLDLGLNIGDECDDGNPLTENDLVDVDCVCVGEACSGNCPLLGLFIGNECNDGDDLTINDVVTCECLCEGISLYCPNLNLYIGDPCDDNDESTFNDIVNIDCECIGFMDPTTSPSNCIGASTIDIGVHSADINGGGGAANICFDSGATNAMWFKFTATMASGLVITSEIDENLPDTRVSTYTGNCLNLSCLGADDDGGENFTSYCEIEVTEGQIIFIEWDDRWSDGPFEFELFYTDLPGECDEDGIPEAIDNCPCVTNFDQYDLDMDGIGDACDEDIDGDFYLNEDDCAPYDASLFPGAFCDDGDPDTYIDVILFEDCECHGVAAPENYNCSEATEVFEGIYNDLGPFAGEMASNMCFESGADNANWYYFTPQEVVEVVITSEIDLNLPDTRLSIYEGSCDDLVCIVSDDDGGEEFTSLVQFTAQENVTYHIEWDDRWTDGPFDWIISSTVGINDAESVFDNIYLFPNPVKDELYISFEIQEPQKIIFEIFDLDGRLVLTKNFNQRTIGEIQQKLLLDELSQGLYFLKINSDYVDITKKFIIVN